MSNVSAQEHAPTSTRTKKSVDQDAHKPTKKPAVVEGAKQNEKKGPVPSASHGAKDTTTAAKKQSDKDRESHAVAKPAVMSLAPSILAPSMSELPLTSLPVSDGEDWKVDLSRPEQYALCMTTAHCNSLLSVFEILKNSLVELSLLFTPETMAIWQCDADKHLMVEFEMQNIVIHCPEPLSIHFQLKKMIHYLKKIKDNEATVSFVMRQASDPLLRIHVRGRSSASCRDFDVPLVPEINNEIIDLNEVYYGSLQLCTKSFYNHIKDTDGTGNLIHLHYTTKEYTIWANDTQGAQVKIRESLVLDDGTRAGPNAPTSTHGTNQVIPKKESVKESVHESSESDNEEEEEEEEDADDSEGEEEENEKVNKKKRKLNKKPSALAPKNKKAKKEEEDSKARQSTGPKNPIQARLTVDKTSLVEHQNLFDYSVGDPSADAWPLKPYSYPARALQSIAKGGKDLSKTLTWRMSLNGLLSLAFDIAEVGTLRFTVCNWSVPTNAAS